MRKLPPMRAVLAFEAAARLGSFAAAAGELGVTPTAISHQIRLLEDISGAALFRRRPRPLTLTAAGARLFPVLRVGLDNFADAFSKLSGQETRKPLRVTTPTAFASHCLVPRLAEWGRAHPDVPLEVIGADAVLDLRSDAADLAIRYARRAPLDVNSLEIVRDSYWPVCVPELLSEAAPIAKAADVLRYPLIHFDWTSRDPEAPTWRQWMAKARALDPALAGAEKSWDLAFREELHAIEAVLGGQGVAIFSDVIVSKYLRSGRLVKASALSLPGYGFYVVSLHSSSRAPEIEAFSSWMKLGFDIRS
ncbi:MAG: LysR family transcriptional regulator [Hyphomicrobiales bacterium]|nr:LysR family transcriptional regulator [Hyphomicrobiales bacterium]